MRNIYITLRKMLPQTFQTWVFKYIFMFLINNSKKFKIDRTNKNTGISILTSHQHLLFAILSIKSFLYFTSIDLGLTFIDDGTITNHDSLLIKKHFPGAYLIRKSEADKEVFTKLKNYEYSQNLRKMKNLGHVFHQKLFDTLLIPDYNKIILLDSDVIFFKEPTKITEWINSGNNTVLHTSYPENKFDKMKKGKIDNPGLKRLQVDLATQRLLTGIWKSFKDFNSGIVCTYTKFINMDIIEKHIRALYNFGIIDSWFIEQFTLNFLFSTLKEKNKADVTSLDREIYYTVQEPELFTKQDKKICIHYHGDYKNRIYQDGIKLLLRNKLFFKTTSYSD